MFYASQLFTIEEKRLNYLSILFLENMKSLLHEEVTKKYTDKQVGKGIIEVCPIVNKTFIFFYIL